MTERPREGQRRRSMIGRRFGSRTVIAELEDRLVGGRDRRRVRVRCRCRVERDVLVNSLYMSVDCCQSCYSRGPHQRRTPERNRALTQARLRANLTQAEVAEHVGIPSVYVCWLEGRRIGLVRLSPENLLDLAHRLGDLLGLEWHQVVDARELVRDPFEPIMSPVVQHDLGVLTDQRRSPDPLELASRCELAEQVLDVLTDVKPRWIDVLWGRARGETLREIGTRLGVSRERVRKIEASALAQARRALGIRRSSG